MARLGMERGLGMLRAVELALCIVVSAALCYTLQGGFNVSEALHANVVLNIAVCAVLQGVLFSCVVNPGLKVAGGIAYGVLFIAACAAAVVLSPMPNPIDDVEQNHFVAVVLFAAVNALVFALSRKRVGCIALFGSGAFLCAFIQFLYTANMLVACAAFLVASGMLMALRSYADTVVAAYEGHALLFGAASAVGVLLPLCACALAGVVVFGVLMPLGLPHAEIKLFNEYVSYEEDRVKTGVELDEKAETSRTSSAVDDSLKPRTTSDRKLADDSQDHADSDAASSNAPKDYLSDEYSDVDLSGVFGNARALALNLPFPWQWLVLGILLLLVFLLAVPRHIVHRVRLRRMAAAAPGEQVELLYAFFLGRFKKLGFEKPEALSPVEYANLYRARLAPYVGAQTAGSFDHLTALLVSRQYAGAEPDDDDLRCMYWMYWEFYARCRRVLGTFGYVFKHLTL